MIGSSRRACWCCMAHLRLVLLACLVTKQTNKTLLQTLILYNYFFFFFFFHGFCLSKQFFLLDLQNPTCLKFQSIENLCKLLRLIAYVSQMGRRNFLTCISLSLMAKLTLRYYSFLMKFSFSFEKNCNRRITMDHFAKNCN